MKHVDAKRLLTMLPVLRQMGASGEDLPAGVEKQMRVMEAALNTLPDEERKALELRYLKCQSALQVAASLHISETTLRRRFDSAFSKILPWLKGGCPACGRHD